MTEFVDKTLTLVKDNEIHRNEYAKNMIHKIMLMLKETNTSVDTGSFDFFKQQLEHFRTDVEKKSHELQTNIEGTASQFKEALTQPVSNENVRGGGIKSGKKKQKGGFVRDHSRFPQSFYTL
jgi:hypothetical protein